MEDFRFKYDKFERITNVTNVPVFSITGSDKTFTSSYQGYIGIAPYQDQYTNKIKSFIYHLKD